MPAEILDDVKKHVGDEKKFVSVADMNMHGVQENA